MRAAGLAVVVASCGCRSNALPPSIWPSADFRLEVFAVEPTRDHTVYRSFQVWATGHALYREAVDILDGVDEVLPVYRTVALYRLQPQSVRTLCRELERAGVLEESEPAVENRESIGPEAKISWWANGARGVASRQQPDRGPLDRGLRVVDGFLPTSRQFGETEPEDVRVAEVPEPLTFIPGALEVHAEVAGSCDVDATFLRELFALAVVAGDRAIAADALRVIEENGPNWGSDELLDVDAWERDEIAPLREILADRFR